MYVFLVYSHSRVYSNQFSATSEKNERERERKHTNCIMESKGEKMQNDSKGGKMQNRESKRLR